MSLARKVYWRAESHAICSHKHRICVFHIRKTPLFRICTENLFATPYYQKLIANQLQPLAKVMYHMSLSVSVSASLSMSVSERAHSFRRKQQQEAARGASQLPRWRCRRNQSPRWWPRGLAGSWARNCVGFPWTTPLEPPQSRGRGEAKWNASLHSSEKWEQTFFRMIDLGNWLTATYNSSIMARYI